MKRGFRGAPRPLLPAMLLVATTNPNAGQEHHVVAQSQPSSSTLPVPSTSSPPVQSPPPIPTPTPIPETEPEPIGHTFEEPSPAHQHFSPPQEQAQGQMTVDDLLQVVPQLMSRIDSLETDLKQTKLTMGSAIVKLVKKVKKLEGILKRRNVVLSDSEEEEPEAQGRKSQDDPLVSLVQGLVTPSKTTVNASGEEQVEDISPTTLEAAKTLSRVASQKPKSIDKGRRYKRRKESKGKKVATSLDFQEEVNTGSIKVSTVSEQVSTGSTKRSIPSPDKGQREGKAPMIIEEAPKKSKEQILQEEASLAEAIRLDTLQKEEEAKQVHLDSLLAQRLAEEEGIKAKIEANAELSKSMLGSDLQGEDFAKKMVDLGTWKLSQLKNLSFEEVKEEFDKAGFVNEKIESFAPIKSEALRDMNEPNQEVWKKRRRKTDARKDAYSSDKDDSDDSDEVSEQDDSGFRYGMDGTRRISYERHKEWLVQEANGFLVSKDWTSPEHTAIALQLKWFSVNPMVMILSGGQGSDYSVDYSWLIDPKLGPTLWDQGMQHGYKEKAMLDEAQEAGQNLDEEQLAFLDRFYGLQMVKLFDNLSKTMLLLQGLRILNTY
ncbi:hypothetical protein Tco_0526706 [Tanacetum coccineum]